MNRARALLEAAYPFPFPESFFLFYEWTQKAAQQGLDLHELMDLSFADPFTALHGVPKAGWDPITDARYFNDPPEFFTILYGHTDGLHYGYWVEDGPAAEYPVVGYWHSDAFELAVYGRSLLEAMAGLIPRAIEGTRENMEYDGEEYADGYRKTLVQLDQLLVSLQPYLPAPGSLDRYTRAPIATTRNRMGIVADPALYYPIHEEDPFGIWNYKPSADDVTEMRAAALEALEDGFPATALKLGKDLWIYRDHAETSVELLELAYTALDRPIQRSMLRYRKGKSAADVPSFKAALDSPSGVTFLHLAGQNIEVIPPAVARLTDIENIVLFNNKLKALPPELGQLPKLWRLHLETNRLTDFPHAVFEMPALKWLHIGGNPFSSIPADSVPERLAELTLSGIHWKRFPHELSAWPALQKLTCQGFGITALPMEIGAFPALTHLEIRSQDVIASADWQIGRSPHLTSVKIGSSVVGRNDEVWRVPPALVDLSSVKALEISTNMVLELPELTGLTALRSLHIGNYQLTAVPSQILTLTELEVLKLPMARIETLPEDLRSFQSLRVLDLYGTRVETFPDWIAELPSLEKIRQSSSRVSTVEKHRLQRLIPNVKLDF